MRVHVVDAANRDTYSRELDDHHRLRHDIYIGERKWRALRGSNGREFDQFDLPDAVYLLALTDEGEIAGGTRLLQSTGPTLLSDIFPQLANARRFGRSPGVLEWTRFFVAARFREEKRLSRTGGLICAAIIDYCLQSGVHTLNAVGETFWMERVGAIGWRPRPLGLAVEHESTSICAFTIDVTEHALTTTLAAYDIDAIRLIWRSQK